MVPFEPGHSAGGPDGRPGRPGPALLSPPPPREPGPRVQRRLRARRLRRALLLTAGSALLPGLGHLALRRRTGALLVAAVLLTAVLGVVLLLATPREALLRYALSPSTLLLVTLGAVAAAVGWVLVILRTFTLARPTGITGGAQVLSLVVVLGLGAGVAVPLGFLARTAYTQRDLLTSVFQAAGPAANKARPLGSSGTLASTWTKPRVNIALLGGDGGPDRVGIRTDSMVVASVDTATGRTVLFSLPRNLERAQFPPGSGAAKAWPRGFYSANSLNDTLLNAVYKYGQDNPSQVPGPRTRYPGAELLKATLGNMLGLEVDYFVLVNLQGFADIVDALGGITVYVPERLPIGGITANGTKVKPVGYIEPGVQHLDGDRALWFARSRLTGDDYIRMGRQRCLLNAIVKQAQPLTVLQKFQQIASATKSNVATDIPQSALPALTELAVKGKRQPISGVSFTPDLPDPNNRSRRFDVTNPDVGFMRTLVAQAIAASTAAPSPPPTATDPVGPGRGATGGPSPAATPAPVSLDEACQPPR